MPPGNATAGHAGDDAALAGLAAPVLAGYAALRQGSAQ